MGPKFPDWMAMATNVRPNPPPMLLAYREQLGHDANSVLEVTLSGRSEPRSTRQGGRWGLT